MVSYVYGRYRPHRTVPGQFCSILSLIFERSLHCLIRLALSLPVHSILAKPRLHASIAFAFAFRLRLSLRLRLPVFLMNLDAGFRM
jgi:hypothetical protein